MRVLSEEQWEEEFIVTTDEMLLEIPSGTDLRYVWTQVESGNDLAVLSGVHPVNNLGFWITENPHDFAVEVELDTLFGD